MVQFGASPVNLTKPINRPATGSMEQAKTFPIPSYRARECRQIKELLHSD